MLLAKIVRLTTLLVSLRADAIYELNVCKYWSLAAMQSGGITLITIDTNRNDQPEVVIAVAQGARSHYFFITDHVMWARKYSCVQNTTSTLTW